MHVVKISGVWWRKVRPFFYRQLYPFHAVADRSLNGPWTSYLGGAQYSVPSEEIANSFLNLRVFDDIQNYSIMNLDKNRRRQVKLGSGKIIIRPLRSIKEFQDEGYRVYMSFYNRTRYDFRVERTKQREFAKWAEAVFSFPKVKILGGYDNDTLCAVSLSYLVEGVIFYATYFSLTEYQKAHVSDVMLHFVRVTAAAYPDVKYIYAGMYAGLKGVDEFYFLRGCKLMRQPALYRVNPVIHAFIRKFMKKEYGKLTGSLQDEGPQRGVDPDVLVGTR
jgi:hypothetical protein